MPLNLDTEISRVQTQIAQVINKEQPIPKALIGYYNDLLGANLDGEINNVDSDTTIAANTEKLFVPSTNTNTAAVLATGSRRLISGLFNNLNTTTQRYLLLYDLATAPTGGDTPDLSIILPPGGAFVLTYEFFPGGVPFTNGIAWAFSTNPDMYSSASAANKVFSFYYT